MSEPIIIVENLGKKYRIAHQQNGTRYKTLRDLVSEKAAGFVKNIKLGNQKIGKKEAGGVQSFPTSKPPVSAAPSSEEFWPLKDVSFEVKPGEVIGIIGRNGAGKSTLLKILSRITEPTEGRVRIRGRVASLLEVGTGFHPELTGRENIYLNAAILGMAKAEITKKFDEIVAFAGVEKFLDTPVKRYSSGMYVRLAFAVAAHLEPEILIVDEVLAVGDAEFQKKCLKKMESVSAGGRTVLFVSHNMAAVRSLCSHAMMLERGRLKLNGDVGFVVKSYLDQGTSEESERIWRDPAKAPGNEHIRLEFARVKPPVDQTSITIDTGATVEIGFYNATEGINLDCTMYVSNFEGVTVFESGCLISRNNDSLRGTYAATCNLPPHLLNCGGYNITLLFGKDQFYPLFRVNDVVNFTVENTATGRGRNFTPSAGVIRPLLHWEQTFHPQGRAFQA